MNEPGVLPRAEETKGGDGSAPEIILDLSRLLSRVLHSTPTGIDRVEMAYARELMRVIPERLAFAGVHPVLGYGRLSRPAVARFLAETERLWQIGDRPSLMRLRIEAARKLFALRPHFTPPRRAGRPRVYLQASPNTLDRPDRVRQILCREQARFVCLVHDLIPISFPEYARPGGAERHGRRMATLARHADALIVNSQATGTALAAHLAPLGPVPPITVAHLGTHIGQDAPSPLHLDVPYFVCVGTIEPRKNHLLLLNLWRRMAEQAGTGETLPKLVLVGRRGWENENVIDMLDRCPALKGHVIEAQRVADGALQALIRGARALLLPSFAEGYGMPVAEALALGVPVLCSDLAAHREVGGPVPDYLDPLDGTGWLAAIRDYALLESSQRAAQCARMAGWTVPDWQGHLAAILAACAQSCVPD